MRDGDWGELTYTFDDVVAHARTRCSRTTGAATCGAKVYESRRTRRSRALREGGYKLVYTDRADQMVDAAARRTRKSADFTYSGGFVVGNDGKVASVLWDSPAFNAGLTVGTQILAVNGRTSTAER